MKISKNFIKSIGFMGGLVVLLVLLSFAFYRNDGIYDVSAVDSKKAFFHKEADNSLNVVFFGDSECYSSFSPLQLYAEYGFTSYVSATSAQRLCDTYAIMEEMFKNQSPDLIIIEANCLFRNPASKYDDNDSVMKFLVKNMPVFTYHSDWKKVGDKVLGLNLKLYDDSLKGFVLRNSVVPYFGGEYMIENNEIEKFPEKSYEYLDKIYELCEKNNCGILIVSTLAPRNWNYEKHNGVTEWAEAKNVPYLDLNIEDGININWLTDTKDGGDHLNLEGSKKVTSFLGSYLCVKYNLPDLRENPEYQTWTDSVMASKVYSMSEH